MDAEYNAMRRRMSRLRFQQGKAPSMEAEDVDDNDPGFRDLVKYWKKHGIPIAKGLMPDLLEEEAKATAKHRGRRKSKELEDLHMTTKGGKLKLRQASLDETLEKSEKPHKINHILANKRSVKRSTSENSMGSSVGSKNHTNSKIATPPTHKKTFTRSLSYKT